MLVLPSEIGPKVIVQVVDAVGKSILSYTIISANKSENKVEIDLRKYPAGMYFVRLQISQGTLVRRVFKQ